MKDIIYQNGDTPLVNGAKTETVLQSIHRELNTAVNDRHNLAINYRKLRESVYPLVEIKEGNTTGRTQEPEFLLEKIIFLIEELHRFNFYDERTFDEMKRIIPFEQ